MTDTVLMLLKQLRDARRQSKTDKVKIAAELLVETGMLPNTPNARYNWAEGCAPGDSTFMVDTDGRRHDNV